MARELKQLRNIGVIAHIDAGKTTVTERMLYYSGAKHCVGKVDSGTTDTDEDPEEQERGITIYSACVTFDWSDVHINLLDTPGHVDFTAEVERCLRVLDGGVVVFSAREGVEAQSETVWRQADKYHVPRVAFINKMDREGADFYGTVDEISDRLGAHPVTLQIPVGAGPSHTNDPFRGILDLVTMELLTFPDDEQDPNYTREPIPDDLAEEADLWREKMLDQLSHFCDDLTELILQEEEIPVELIRQTIREATIAHQIQPVLCGSALHGIGVQPVLDAVAHYLPCPLDMPPVEGTEPAKSKGKGGKGSKSRAKAAQAEGEEIPTKKLARKPDPKEPFCGLVFKILPAKTGDVYWIRVYSGELTANSRVYNPGKDKKENVSQLWQLHATKRDEMLPEVSTGDIVGLIGPKDSITGDTLCDTRAPILLESIEFPETVIAMAIEPESTAERKKLADTLEMMKRQDPTFRARENEDTGQTIISGMGELHLEVIKHRLLRDFNLDVKVHKPRVSYRETIGQAIEVTGECHRTIAGQQLFAKVKIRMEPHDGDQTGVLVINHCIGDDLPWPLVEAALDELHSRAEGGGLIGSFPLSKLKVTLLGGEAQVEGSTEVAFRIAAGEAFEAALKQGNPVLLEPIMRLNITTPEDYLGDFVGDLQQRRAIIAKTGQRGKNSTIEAHAPLAELFGYSSAMRSLSQGRAGCSIEPLEYAAAPPEVAEGFSL
jgi:elongation factor G